MWEHGRIGSSLTDLKLRVSRTLEDRRRAQRQLALAGGEAHGLDVFICYNNLDAVHARRVADGLRRRKINVWHDERNLQLGSPIASVIAEAIDGCKVSLVLLGQHGVGPFQELELEALIEKQYRQRRAAMAEAVICPVLLTPSTTTPFKLGVVGRSAFTLGDDDSRLDLLADEVEALLA